MKKLVLLMILIVGSIILAGCAKQEENYICKQNSDCVLAIHIDECCSCPSAYTKEQIKVDNSLVVYEFGKDYSSLITAKEDCSKLACKPCQLATATMCIDNKCIIQTI